jgi:hypothetical protein
LLSGIGVAAVAEFDQHLQALRRREARIPARVGFVGFLETGKDPDRLLHNPIISREKPLRSVVPTFPT